MPELAQVEGRFREIARGKLGDAHVQAALDLSTNRLRTHRLAAWEGLPDVEALRERAHAIRMAVIDDLDGHVARFTEALEARGGRVFFARTAEEASGYVADVCRRRGAKLVAKSKSMATEEIGLNEALEAAGVRPVETDLGEYILQLAGEHPVHIVAPAIEKTASQVAELFSRVTGEDVPAELEAADEDCARAPARVVPAGGCRGHRCELRRLLDRLDLPGDERRERATRQLDSTRAHRGDGDGAARADDRRPRRAAEAPRS